MAPSTEPQRKRPRNGNTSNTTSTHRKQRRRTVSIALPGSIVANAQSPELQTYVAGQIARAAAVFCIDEIVVFHEDDDTNKQEYGHDARGQGAPEPVSFLITILRYLETPQYLRKLLFPMSKSLRYVGLLNPLNLPSHLSLTDQSQWREGVVVNRNGFLDTHKKTDSRGREEQTATRISPFVQAGLRRLVQLQRPLDVGTRVTIDLGDNHGDHNSFPGRYILAKAVDPEIRDEVVDQYWGYQVRQARSLSDVILNSPYQKGYDLVLGTSERGTPVNQPDLCLPAADHILLVFGGVHGLEHSASCDPVLLEKGIGVTGNVAVADLFDYYLNTCPKQGSRTIRTEEAIPISLAIFQSLKVI